MNTKLADITVILDRSGSMQSCKTDVDGGLKAFIKAQQDASKVDGCERRFTLVQFDDRYETVCSNVKIEDAPEFKLQPRGSTALLDAVGNTINAIGIRLSAINENDRPGLVTVVIVTDGEENSSKEFKLDQIKKMTELQRNTYSWEFIFLGANQDAFAEASKLGISGAMASNFTGAASGNAFASASNLNTRCYSAKLSGSTETQTFLSEERMAMVDPTLKVKIQPTIPTTPTV